MEVAIELHIVFLAMSILTLAFCCRNAKLTNTALINLCISLLMWELSILIPEMYFCSINLNQVKHHICFFCLVKMHHFEMPHHVFYIFSPQILYIVIGGVQYFFYLSSFMWMISEAVLLLICAKNLSNISSHGGEGLNWKWLMVIGYPIPLILMGVSAAAFINGNINKK